MYMKKNYLKKSAAVVMICLPILNSYAQIEIRTAQDIRNIKNDFRGNYKLMIE